MDMHPPTDTEQCSLPQVMLTSDLDWHPSSVDHEYDCETWFDAMDELPDLDCDSPFDEHGECLNTHEVAAITALVNHATDLDNNCIVNTKETIHQATQPR